MYGVDFFSSIINPPNAAILSVGTTKAKPIVDDLGRIVSGHRMMLGLSCDQRVVERRNRSIFSQSSRRNIGKSYIDACLGSL